MSKAQRLSGVVGPIAYALPVAEEDVIMGTPVEHSPAMREPNAARSWSSGLFDCFADCCSCWAVICCWPNVYGQLAERVWRRKSCPGLPSSSLCFIIASLFWVGYAYSFMQQPQYDEGHMHRHEHAHKPDNAAGAAVALLSLIGSAVGLASCLLTCALRRTIRRRERIPATLCACCDGVLDDCVCAVCCLCCVNTQVMRHEGLTHGRYELCSRDGLAAKYTMHDALPV